MNILEKIKFNLSNKKRIFLFATFAIPLVAFSVLSVDAQEVNPDFPTDKFSVGKVISFTPNSTSEDDSIYTPWNIKIELLSGDEKGREIEITKFTYGNNSEYLGLDVSETLVIRKSEVMGDIEYSIHDKLRLWPMAMILLFFFILVIILSRAKGVGSILGLTISIAILAIYIVPMIIAGYNPLLITLSGAAVISTLSIYLAHGFTKRTTLALLSIIATLGIAGALSILFIWLTKLSGAGSEEIYYLQISGMEGFNLKDILLSGIIVGVLGVLDDITTTQTAVIGELRQVNPSISTKELYRRGIAVGKEHIASLVNTLALAYAGASLPLFMLFAINPNDMPFWVIINSEFIVEEFVRTIVGSSALVLAVPIATFLAVKFLKEHQNLKTHKAQID